MTNRVTRKTKNVPQKSRNYEVIKHFQPSVRHSQDEKSPIPLVNVENDKPMQSPKKPQRKPLKTNTTTVQGVTAKKVWKSPLKSSSSSSLESKMQKFTNKYTVRCKSFHGGTSQDVKPITKSRNLKSVTDPKLVHLDLLKQEILENKLMQKSCVSYRGNLIKPVEDLKTEIYQSKSSDIKQKKMLITELKSEIAQYKQFSSFQVYNSYERQDGDKKKLENEHSGSSEGDQSIVKPGTAVSTRRSSESSLDKAELTHLIGCSIADSASDDLIKNKIQEANLLIERVKLALDKIKAIKTGDTQVKSSSTENEDLKNEESVAEAVPSKELKEDIKVSKQVCGPGSFKKVCHAKTRVNRLERPKTRRNEADDEMTEDVARNKFRNVPEDRHLNENGSLVELQTKLQTISETTESDHSITRTPSLLLKIDKEVQATPSVITVGVSSNYSRENKQVQTSPLHNSKEVIVQTDDLPIKVVKPPVKRCEIECLPILEVLPEPEACVCQKCKTVLNKENLTGLSICSKPQKLQKLAVQVLPPVVIPESMTLTPVLHLSISPNGHTENHVKNSKNVAFVSNYYDPEPKAHIEFLDERSIKEIPQDEEGEEQKKMLVCKSYQIYDNPNKHDPGELDKQSLAKVSHLDVDFYRTFINPDPVMSEPRLGFVSKSTQCDWGDLDQESLNPHLPHKKINFSLHGNDVDNTSIVGGRSITSNIESTVTVLRLNPNLTDDDEDILNPYASKFVLHGSYEGKSQDDSSPSAITVTMSYSLSSDENTSLNKESKSNKSSANEVQLKVTNFEKDERTLTAKDTTMIKQIREKLQSLDATGGEKPYYQFLNSSFDLSKKADLHLKDPTVNYVLGGSSAKHLELGPNGRYKDEEHLFSQTAHPKTTFEHRDVEMAGDKLFKLPPRLRRLDTSNSDTITTNSQLSEGELLCKHSVSNGELHQCHYRPFKTRNILTKSSRVLRKRPSRKIDFRDPSVSVELRRNYFNNWVTYYVKPQDVYESTISGSNSSTVQ